MEMFGYANNIYLFDFVMLFTSAVLIDLIMLQMKLNNS